MNLHAMTEQSSKLTRRGVAGLLLGPAVAMARHPFGRDEDYGRGEYGRRGYSRIWRASPSDNYEPYRRDGRFDLRAFVDGEAEFAIRGDEVAWRVFHGGAPRNAGCEFRKEMPRGELYGLRLDQRDGRTRIQILDTPSAGNGWALVLGIRDHKGGDDRYHARITWESDSSFERWRDGRGFGRSRSSYGHDPYGWDRY